MIGRPISAQVRPTRSKRAAGAERLRRLAGQLLDVGARRECARSGAGQDDARQSGSASRLLEGSDELGEEAERDGVGRPAGRS